VAGKPRSEAKRIVLDLSGTAALCVFRVFCGSIFGIAAKTNAATGA
jgi:hypothetical protein